MRRIFHMGSIGSERTFADLAKWRRWERESEFRTDFQLLRQFLMKTVLFQNPFLEFVFLKLSGSNKVFLNEGEIYHSSWKHKSWGVEFPVSEEGRNNRIRRFVGTRLEGLLLWRRGKINGNRRIVTVGAQREKRECIGTHTDCLVFWLELYLQSKFQLLIKYERILFLPTIIIDFLTTLTIRSEWIFDKPLLFPEKFEYCSQKALPSGTL